MGARGSEMALTVLPGMDDVLIFRSKSMRDHLAIHVLATLKMKW